jgi:hypothetical protein
MHEEDEIKDHPGVAKIKKMWDNGDFETIDKMVRFWEALENLGMLGEVLKRFILWFGIIAGAYLIANNHISDWIRSIRQ